MNGVKQLEMSGRNKGRGSLRRRIAAHFPYYLLLALPLADVIVFSYLPMYGIQIAFRDFKMGRGITGSKWIGTANFAKMFGEKQFYRILSNTLRISLESIIIIFPLTIIFALMINEIQRNKFKRVTQTITYLPHFLSWIMVGDFVYQFLSPTYGSFNAILMGLRLIDKPIYFVTNTAYYDTIFIITSIWKELGWSVIIYLAAIAGIDSTLYEAATIDGANRFQRVLTITLPSILPTISTLLILRLGSLMSVSFDATFNLYNSGTYEVADVLSTYVYRRGLIDGKYSYTTAVGLFQNAVGLLLVLLSNYIARKADPSYRIL